MSDYINRAALLDDVYKSKIENPHSLSRDRAMHSYEHDHFLAMIDAVPAADVAPVVYGEWSHLGGDEWCCTNCGNVIHTEGSWERPEQKYCEECGAKMNGGKQ